ncbi:GNVR domain-containing protein [Balneola sp. MJW-20]|uniref:GNVR domain-containing protein n=1 Tax=Gracilimonas aurantiaca TaxID=3234185 RepID=UPI00346797B9
MQEYKIVPIEESVSDEAGQGIDLIELIKKIWTERTKVLKYAAYGALIGIFIAFLSPVEYKSSATLMPEIQTEQAAGGIGSALQKYSGLLGISGNGLMQGGSGSISVILYPDIVQSLPFQLKMMDQEVKFSSYDTTISVFTYFDEFYSPGILSLIKDYTIELPFKIRDAIFKGNSDESQNNGLPSGILNLSKNEIDIIENLRNRINVTINEENGVVAVSVMMPEANASAVLTQFAIDELTRYVTEYRIEKASQDLLFIEVQMNEARTRFENAQLAVAEFNDQNQGSLTNRAQTELQRLNSIRNLTENVYNSLAQQYEEAKIRVQEETPIFKVLQPVQVPVEKTSPKRSLILIIYTILGVGVSILIILLKETPFFKKDDEIGD